MTTRLRRCRRATRSATSAGEAEVGSRSSARCQRVSPARTTCVVRVCAGPIGRAGTGRACCAAAACGSASPGPRGAAAAWPRGGTLARATPRPANSRRRSAGGHPTQVVARRRPRDIASTTAATQISTDHAAHPTSSHQATANSRSSKVWESRFMLNAFVCLRLHQASLRIGWCQPFVHRRFVFRRLRAPHRA